MAVWITVRTSGFIDAHSERCGGHHDFQLAGHEFFLHSPPLLGIEPGMVAGGGELARQFLGKARPPACASVCRQWPAGAGLRAISPARAKAAATAELPQSRPQYCRGEIHG